MFPNYSIVPGYKWVYHTSNESWISEVSNDINNVVVFMRKLCEIVKNATIKLYLLITLKGCDVIPVGIRCLSGLLGFPAILSVWGGTWIIQNLSYLPYL